MTILGEKEKFFISETGSHYVAQTTLKFGRLRQEEHKYWDYRLYHHTQPNQ